ncbi:low specificity L-threonine aldolase [[Candida] railenensis]|uniref:low-specificity L-threonine aldolase n=1 Tax=[Candida] railenensis TaxID=45579 RepID=A0A9P0VXK9_9ASCO|nr:low specificity L-threonine aldolase [[Candida] railenensis]
MSAFENSPASKEFRSDTFTSPTVSMVNAMQLATLGDSVYNEDETTIALEKKVAKIADKPAGLYCVSGTLSNQIALRCHLFQPPHSVLCDYRSHVYVHEAGGLPTLSQAMVQPIIPKNGIHLTLEDDILPVFIPDDGEIHGAPTKVISLENTLHGMIFPLDEIKKISEFCKANDVKLHLDGARLWNASVETGISIAEYGKYFDSISLCLSKTLGAPVGSVLVGESKFILKANHFKKQNGGGIRQAGILTSMASVAIDENLPKLKQTHEWAKELGQLCEENGIQLEHPVHTNFVFLDLKATKIDPDLLERLGKEEGIVLGGSRIAYHYQLSKESRESVKKVVLEAFESAKKNPYVGSNVHKFYNVTGEKN